MIVKHFCDQFRELVCDADILVEVCGRFDAVFAMEFSSEVCRFMF